MINTLNSLGKGMKRIKKKEVVLKPFALYAQM